MRIAVDARELHGRPTGVGRFLSAVLHEWKSLPEARGLEFVLLAPDGDGGTAWEQVVLPRLVRECGAKVLFSPAYSGPVFPPVPMVVAIHDVSFATHPDWFTWREGARRRTIVRLAARAATRIITISQFSRREIAAHLGVNDSTIVVAYPGATSFPVTPGQATIDTSPCRTVLFVGSVFNRRHIPELIEGFSRLARARPDVDLDIIGDNRTSPRIDLAAVAAAAGLSDRVRLRDYVTDNDLSTAYRRAAAFVFLSDYEGFGLTPLEAMAGGLPVLLLDTPVAREVFSEAALYISRPEPELIERGLERVLFDAGERQRQVDAGRVVVTRYSWTNCARQILRVLLESARG